jgi:drug/metabolite transporter (DMT)-like permease
VNKQRRTVSTVEVLLLTLIVAGLGLMIGQAFEPPWVSLLLALTGAVAMAVALVLGREWPVRGRLLPPGAIIVFGILGAVTLTVVLFLPYGNDDGGPIVRAAAAGIPTALLYAVLGAVRLRRDAPTGD